MGSALEFARAHFSARARIRVDVPEWADEAGNALVIHASPLTLAEKQKIDRHREDKGRQSALAFTLVLKAEKENGEKHFRLDDLPALMNKVDPDVLARVVVSIVLPDPGDAEGAPGSAGK